MSDIEIKDIRKVRLDPEDLLVVKVDRLLSSEMYRRITENMRKLFPHNKVAILEKGVDLEVYYHGYQKKEPE